MSLTLLDSAVANNDAYVDLGKTANWDSSFNTYMVVIRNGETVNDATNILARVLVSDSVQSSAIYQVTGLTLQSDSNAIVTKGEGQTYMNIQSNSGTGTQEITNSEIILFNMNSSSYYKYWFSNQTAINSNSVVQGRTVGGVWESTSACNGVRLFALSGNIASGKFLLYGYSK